MEDKNFCMSSYLAFRYVIDDSRDFFEGISHRTYEHICDGKKKVVFNENDIDEEIRKQIDELEGKKIGLLLSGGMDSACLASYMKGREAYTFRFIDGFSKQELVHEELKRATYYAKKNHMNLHYVDINWEKVDECLNRIMIVKGAPVHSIEPQIYLAANQAKQDGVNCMVIGDAADYVFGGMDKLLSREWKYNDFIGRYMYIKPEEILVNAVDMRYVFEEYKRDEGIDFISFMHKYTDTESYSSYENAFFASGMQYLDPYEKLVMGDRLDLRRIRNGESKYLIRALFKMKYEEIDIPTKFPMPRPVDAYMKNWGGPNRKEFFEDINVSNYSGDQLWLMYCLERFLNVMEK